MIKFLERVIDTVIDTALATFLLLVGVGVGLLPLWVTLYVIVKYVVLD